MPSDGELARTKISKIGYLGYSDNLLHPGDRRLIVPWAKARNYEITSWDDPTAEIVMLSARASLQQVRKSANRIPTVFIVLDGYSSACLLWKDFGRNFIKALKGESSRWFGRYSQEVLSSACASHLTICGSLEQQVLLTSQGVPVVKSLLASSQEFSVPPVQRLRDRSEDLPIRFLWEGMIPSVESIGLVVEALNLFSRQTGRPCHLSLFSDLQYFWVSNRFVKRKSIKVLQKVLAKAEFSWSLHRWELSSLATQAESSDIFLVPVNSSFELASLKPENRIMIGWRLGLPVLCSETPSHNRVQADLELPMCASSTEEWLKLVMDYAASPTLRQLNLERGRGYLDRFGSDEQLFSGLDASASEAIRRYLSGVRSG